MCVLVMCLNVCVGGVSECVLVVCLNVCWWCV